jgi:hypothetical protein
MIIKSMSRKKATFSQLIDYIQRGASSEQHTCYHNTTERHAEGLKREFEANARHVRTRKNGVYLYHEIISLKRQTHLSLEEQKEKLASITRSYLQARAPHQLAFGMIHDDHTEHLHFHLVISSNKIESTERVRLSKEQFSEIQTHLERHVLTTYPELEQQAVFYGNLTPEQKEAKQSKARLSNQGAELKRRTGKTPERDQVKATLEAIFSTSTTPQAFTESMNDAGFTFYQRGKHAGITDRDGKKYRFATLGLAEQWATFDATMRASMSQHHTPKKAHSSVSVQSDTSSAKATDTDQHTPNDRILRETVIGGMVAETLDSMKDLLNDATDFNSWEAEQQRRLKQMQERREQQAKDRQTHHHGQGYKPKP